MAITNIVTSVEHSIGIRPATVLIDTTDALATILGTGYLNGTDVTYNITYSNKQMMLVKANEGLVWLQCSIVGANTSLIRPVQIAKTQASASRTLNTVFQISSSQESFVTYSVDIAATISLTTGQSGTAILEIASNSGFTTNVQTLAQFTNGNAGTLTDGLNLTQTNTACLTGYVPAGYYCRIRTVNNTGTPTFTYKSGQEVFI